MPRTLRRTSVAALAVATLALTAACGGGGKSSDDQAKDPDAAPAKELAAGSTLSTADAKSVMSAAVASMTSMKVSGDFTVPSAGSIHMDGVEQTKPTVLAEFTETIEGQKIVARMVGQKMYMQMPSGAGLPSGKKWMSLNFGDLGSITGMDTSSLGSAMSDPASSITKFGQYVTGATYVGDEQVDGTKAKHYTFTVDMGAALGAMMPSGVPSSVGTQLPSSAKEDFWVDGDDHPVQVKMDMGQKLGTITMHMSDFGTKVAVTAPPADQVTDMKSLLGQAGQS